MAGDVVRELVARLGYEVDTSGLDEWMAGTDGATTSTEALGESAGTAEEQTIAMGVAMGNAITKIAEMGVQAAVTAGKFAIELVTGFATTGDEIAKTSRQIGVATDDLQELRFAAERSGVSNSSLDKSLKQLQIGLIDAKTKGTGPFQEGMDLLGITLDEFDGIGTVEQLGLIADAMNELDDEQTKTAAGAKIFGARAGVEMKTLLEDGAAGIQGLAMEARKLGGVLGEDALKSAEGLADSFTNLDTLAGGLEARIGGALAPTVTAAIDKFTDWVSENDKLIQQDLPEFLELIIKAGEEFLPVLIEVAVETKQLFTEIKQLDERLTEDAGPAWALFKSHMEAILNPIDMISRGVAGINDALDALSERLPIIGLAWKAAAGPIALAGGSDEEVAERGAKGFLAGIPEGEAAALAKAEAKKDEAEDEGQSRHDRASERASFAKKALLDKAQRSEDSTAIKDQFSDVRSSKKKTQINALADQVASGEISSRQARREAIAIANSGKKGGGGGGKKKSGGGKDSKSEPTADELVAEFGSGAKAGASRSAAGGGASPLAGASITTINAPFTDNSQINIDMGDAGITSGTATELAEQVAAIVVDQKRESHRRVIEHLSETPRT